MRGHEVVDAIERVGGDAAAVAQSRRELAVVDGTAAERRFGKPGLSAIIRDFLQEFLSVHREARSSKSPSGAVLRRPRFLRNEPSEPAGVNHKIAHTWSGQDSGIVPVAITFRKLRQRVLREWFASRPRA
jgi:hypothetical protein